MIGLTNCSPSKPSYRASAKILSRLARKKEALRQLLQMDFAVILLDVSMPVMDGFETASLIRKRPSSEHTPIIFVTSINNSENHIAKGYSLGAVDNMSTPSSRMSCAAKLPSSSNCTTNQSSSRPRPRNCVAPRSLNISVNWPT